MKKARDVNEIRRQRGERITSFFAVFSLIFVRYLYFGFKYFPQLDDYIQYHNYAAEGDLSYTINRLGLLAARPFSGLLDITFWSKIFPVMIIGVGIISAVYAISALIIKNIFEKHFGTGWFFVVVFTLLPLGFEGAYWMSASTRIIVGLLFAALSAKFIDRFFEGAPLNCLYLSMLFQLVALCFYEQAFVFSISLNMVLAALYIKRGDKRYWFVFTFVLNFIIYFIFTKIAGASALYSARTNIITPFSDGYFTSFLPSLVKQICAAIFGGGFFTWFYGLVRGGLIMYHGGAWIYLLAVIVLCVLFFLFAYRAKKAGEEKYFAPIIAGVFLTFAPCATFLIIANPHFSMRNALFSMVGIALVLDAVVRLISIKSKKTQAWFCMLFAFMFCICAVSEMNDYKLCYDADTKAVTTISKIYGQVPEGSDVLVLGVEPTYLKEQNFYYHEHIHGVTESDWALTGAVRYMTGDVKSANKYTPLSRSAKAFPYNIDDFDFVYSYNFDSDDLQILTVAKEDDKTVLYDNAEKFYAEIGDGEISWEE